MVDEDDGDVVRARRFEVVDDRRRVRAVLGQLAGRGDSGEIVGLEILDRTGSARAWLMDEDGVGVQLALALGGNQVLVLAAYEASAEVLGGVSVTLCDKDGVPVLVWHVSGEGDSVTPSPQT